MILLREVCPSGSYVVRIPEGAEEDIDGTTASYWVGGDDLLLQVSSYARDAGLQIGAGDRLRDRLATENFSDVAAVELGIASCPDVAAATARDDDGVHWMFVYAVWPSLTVFMTVSHPERDVTGSSWARDAVQSIELKRDAGN